jgi:hypothetical protein
MATNQAMRQGIFEGILFPFLTAGEAMSAGDVVALDTSNAGKVIKCGTSAIPFGFVAEEVTASGVPDYYPGGLVSHTAKVGDYVGVYICGGVYVHKAATAATYGAELYSGTSTAGKATTTASSNATKIGICVEAKDATTTLCKLKSYL